MVSAEPSSFGELLRRFRTAARLTQEELAEREHVYQLTHPELPAEFPLLRSLETGGTTCLSSSPVS